MLSKVIKYLIFVLLKKKKKNIAVFHLKVIYLNLNLSSVLLPGFQFTAVAQSENVIVQFAFTSPDIILNARYI